MSSTETQPASETRGTRTESFVANVQRELERMIAAGELEGGERINESALALKLGISRGPIREACRTLERTGLLRSEVNRGFFVREISVKDALDIYDMRAALFAMAGRLAVSIITSQQLAELENLVDRMDEAVDRDDVAGFYPLNGEFHVKLVKAADNHKLSEVWPTLEGELHLFRRKGLVIPGSLRVSNYEHRAIVTAIRAGDAVEAERLMGQHIQSGKARLLKRITAAPPDPGRR